MEMWRNRSIWFYHLLLGLVNMTSVYAAYTVPVILKAVFLLISYTHGSPCLKSQSYKYCWNSSWKGTVLCVRLFCVFVCAKESCRLKSFWERAKENDNYISMDMDKLHVQLVSLFLFWEMNYKEQILYNIYHRIPSSREFWLPLGVVVHGSPGSSAIDSVSKLH